MRGILQLDTVSWPDSACAGSAPAQKGNRRPCRSPEFQSPAMRPRSAGRDAPGFIDQDFEKLALARIQILGSPARSSLSSESLPMYSQVARSAFRPLAYELPPSLSLSLARSETQRPTARLPDCFAPGPLKFQHVCARGPPENTGASENASARQS